MSYNYLSLEELMFFNKLQIESLSPQEPVGVASMSSLEMIVEQPKATVFGEDVYKDISEKAGIMYINLVKKHPFFNANKRTAAMALDVFLEMNGYQLEFTDEKLIELTVEVAVYSGDFDSLKKKVFSEIKNGMSKKSDQ